MYMPHSSNTQLLTESDSNSNGKLEGMQWDEEERQIIYEVQHTKSNIVFPQLNCVISELFSLGCLCYQ